MKKTTGERLKELRKEKGEKQEVVAKALSIDRSVLSNYENDVRTPDIEKFQALANYYNVTVDFLLCRSDVKKADTTLQAVSEYIGLSDEAILKIKSMKNEQENIEIIEKFVKDRLFMKALETFIYVSKNIDRF